jgi:hypothetical protein
MPLRRCRWKSLTDRNGPNVSVVPGTPQSYKCPPSTAVILISSFERRNGGGRERISSIIPLNCLKSHFFDSSLRLFTHPIPIISPFNLSMRIQVLPRHLNAQYILSTGIDVFWAMKRMADASESWTKGPYLTQRLFVSINMLPLIGRRGWRSLMVRRARWRIRKVSLIELGGGLLIIRGVVAMVSWSHGLLLCRQFQLERSIV